MHVADTFWNGVYPFIDYSTGGSIDGMIAACDANLAIATRRHDHHRRARRGGQQQVRAQGLPRHAGRRAGECRGAKKAGQIARRDGRGKTDRRLRRRSSAPGSSIPAFFTRLVVRRGVILAPASRSPPARARPRAGSKERSPSSPARAPASVLPRRSGLRLRALMSSWQAGADLSSTPRSPRPAASPAASNATFPILAISTGFSQWSWTRPEQSTSCSPMRAGASSPRSERLPKTSSTEPSPSM